MYQQKKFNKQDTFILQSDLVGDISQMQFSPANFKEECLFTSHWDSFLRCFKLNQTNDGIISKTLFEVKPHEEPILCFDVSSDGKIYSGSCDNTIALYDINNPSHFETIGKHTEPVSQIKYIPELQVLMSGSWDKTISFWDRRQKRSILTVSIPNPVKALDIKYPLLMVASTRRDALLLDLRNPNVILKNFDTALKDNYTCVSIFPDKAGFLLGSIEGRVTVHFINPSDSKFTFSFKCHRDGNKVYPVQSIDFHPYYGTFSTTGSDGKINFWDKDARQRLYFINDYSDPIPHGKFNYDGSLFAYSICDDFHQGFKKRKVSIGIHFVKDKIKNNGAPKYRNQSDSSSNFEF